VKDGPSELSCFLIALAFVLLFLGLSLASNGAVGAHVWAWLTHLYQRLVADLPQRV
jgi:hypothetical protein